jgi:hypothetical protein
LKVSRALQAYWIRQYKIEAKRQETARDNRDLMKKAVNKRIELVLYVQRIKKLYLIKQTQLGKNIDRMC